MSLLITQTGNFTHGNTSAIRIFWKFQARRNALGCQRSESIPQWGARTLKESDRQGARGCSRRELSAAIGGGSPLGSEKYVLSWSQRSRRTADSISTRIRHRVASNHHK